MIELSVMATILACIFLICYVAVVVHFITGYAVSIYLRNKNERTDKAS